MSAAIWCRSLPVSTENSEAILSFFNLMYTAQVEITNHRFECSKTVPIALYHCLFQSTKTNPTSKRVFRLCSHYAAGSREIALVPDTKT